MTPLSLGWLDLALSSGRPAPAPTNPVVPNYLPPINGAIYLKPTNDTSNPVLPIGTTRFRHVLFGEPPANLVEIRSDTYRCGWVDNLGPTLPRPRDWLLA